MRVEALPAGRVDETTEDRLAELPEAVAAAGGAAAVVSAVGNWELVAVRLVVDDVSGPVEAAQRAVQTVVAAASQFDVAFDMVCAVEAVAGEVFRRRLDEPLYPSMAGVAEAAELLGVSRQRVSQLHRQGRLPTPVAELASGPVWTLPSLEAWLEQWDRTRGGRRNPQAS